MVDQFGRWYPDYPGQQPYQDPQYVRAVGQPVPGHQPGQTQNAAQGAAQDMTPTISMQMKQVDSLDAINRLPLAAGTTGAYMTKDEKNIVFRTMYANGEHSDRIYDERPPAPPAPKFDPAEYVRKDEMEQLVKDALAAYIASMKEAGKEG